MTKKIKVLVVDDEIQFLNTLTKRLRMRGVDVTAASSGAEAMNELSDSAFDIAILDLRMPGISGEELLDIIKEKRPLMEVVILTGHGSSDSEQQCISAGSYSYLQKPCETSELIEVLKSAYQRRVARKLNFSPEKIKSMIGETEDQSPLAVLKKLQEIDENGEL